MQTTAEEGWSPYREPVSKYLFPLGDMWHVQLSLYNGDVCANVRKFTTGIILALF